MNPSKTDLAGIVERLIDAEVDFILVGALAAVSQGAPVTTFDVDIVQRREEDNVDRLMALLGDLGAHHRTTDDRHIPPSRDALLGPGHSLLQTPLGFLDVLGTIEGGEDFESLLEDSVEVPFRGKTVRVLTLARIIELKRASEDPKDIQRLPVYEETYRQKKR